LAKLMILNFKVLTLFCGAISVIQM
jgi:hypothetical protein